MACMPVYNERSLTNDVIFSEVFDDTLQNLQLVIPDITREIIDADEKLMNIINKIVLKQYTKKELKTYPNLTTILTTNEIDYIKTKFDNADLLLIPIAFNIKTTAESAMGGYTFGYSNFRLYDLNAYDFIFESPTKLNVNVGGEAGARGMTEVLMVDTYVCYEKNLLKKHNIK